MSKDGALPTRLDRVINPVTGLSEGWDEFYKLPRVRQEGPELLTFEGQRSALHHIPLGSRLHLDFFAKLEQGNELIVTFSGSIPRHKPLYPTFWRVSTFRNVSPALIAFADPTLLLDTTEEMRVGWYLGGSAFDPAHLFLKVIQRAKQKTGAEHVAFVGGSGGGLPALRMSSLIPGSMAYIHEGATSLQNSTPLSVDRYFDAAWPGWNRDNLIEAFPERFDMVRHYGQNAPPNFVYSVQSEGDTWFRKDHYIPFKNASGVWQESGVGRFGDRHFVLYKGDVIGHGKVTSREFTHHFGLALERWREWRASC